MIALHVKTSFLTVLQKSAVEADNLKLEIANRDNKIRDLEKMISDLELDVGMKENLREKSQQRMASNISQHAVSTLPRFPSCAKCL